MESFKPSDTVLVTGANGHVASHTVHQLLALKDGPKVRATVRAETSASGLRTVFSEALKDGKLEIVQVPDMTADGAFDSAVEDVTYIAHIASPLVQSPEDLEKDLLEPAAKGTTGVLESASKQRSKTLKRVVITSSFAAVFDPLKPFPQTGLKYSSADWSTLTKDLAVRAHAAAGDQKELPELGRYTVFTPYLLSKKAAEQGAWEFYNARKAELSWTLSTVNPTYIGGPSVMPLTKTADGQIKGLSFSQSLIKSVAEGKAPQDDFPNWIDVRDVAQAHIRALLSPAAQNRRFILANGQTTYADMAASISRVSTKWTPPKDIEKPACFTIDTSDAQTTLDFDRWIDNDKMFGDLLSQIESL